MNENIDPATPTSVGADYTEQLDKLITYAEIIAGGVIEIVWIAKVFLVFYIIFGAWRVVRK
ncbi:hypothetical protein ACTHQ8_22695 [Lysinibacillus odysseyi]|uniref:hypothetical protein n=1 Tax=Lysinibacillus odysseyi TaxID=202611 RepID=UPI003F81C968